MHWNAKGASLNRSNHKKLATETGACWWFIKIQVWSKWAEIAVGREFGSAPAEKVENHRA